LKKEFLHIKLKRLKKKREKRNVEPRERIEGQDDKDVKGGSILADPEEKSQRKFDDWHSHKHEKNRDKSELYREGELHGVVGHEIYEELKRENELRIDNLEKIRDEDFSGEVDEQKNINEKHLQKSISQEQKKRHTGN